MLQQTVSKSKFKAHLLEYLRILEEDKQTLVITHDNKPVAKVIPYKEESKDKAIRESLKGSVVFYIDPDKPAIDPEDWEMLK